MRRLAQWLSLLACAISLAGCLSESVERREVTLNADGSGILRLVTTYSSTNAADVAAKLSDLRSRASKTNMTAVGFYNVRHVVVANVGTQAVVRTTARFQDWSALGKWLCAGVEKFDPQRDLTAKREADQLVFNVVVAIMADSQPEKPPETAEIEEPYLEVKVGRAIVLDTNADVVDKADGRLQWKPRTIASHGIFFRVELPRGN